MNNTNTTLHTVPTPDEIAALEAADLVTVRPHNAFPLRIVNYTPRAQYERAWTSALLQCRGLVYDFDWRLVARPFPKFFNYEEHLGESPLAGPLPTGPYTVTMKFDGSLGIVFRWKAELLLATRGSFHSEQAERGTDILYRAMVQQGWRFPEEGYTHLFEIIYPENRIVVDYGQEERLQWITTIENATGNEDPSLGIDFGGITQHPALDPLELKGAEQHNAEGFVLRYATGQRVKIKFDRYVELHKLVTGLDSVAIWECLRSGQDPLEALAALPDELYGWARDVSNGLKKAFHAKQDEWGYAYERIETSLIASGMDPKTHRRDFAMLALTQPVPAALFLILDGKWARYDELTWDTIKPERTKPTNTETC